MIKFNIYFVYLFVFFLNKCYLAYAKGALNKDHLLIIPIDHVQSSINCDDELLEEINKYPFLN